MLNSENMSSLFSKLDDLKKVFVYGERLIPVIHSLAVFMKETVPLLENINRSIADSTAKIPKAQNQINSITSATELATTEILDLVDVLNKDLKDIEASLLDLIVKDNEKKEFLKSLIPHLNMKNAESYINDFITNNDCSEKLGDDLLLVGKMRTDSNNIAISLQVQDITAQQLATVNHLIESVQEKLSGLIADFDKNKLGVPDDKSLNLPSNATFNPSARYTKSNIAQQEVDSIFNSTKVKTASQEEIDKLFK